MKLTLVEKVMVFLGYKYVLNKRSDEIHRLDNKHKNCGLQFMSKCNKQYITEKQKDVLFADGDTDGCRWCWNEKNHG